MPSREKLAEFTAWCRKNVTGDEKGQAQIFLDRLFQAFGQPGCLDVGGATEFRLRKSDQDGGGTAFADYFWKSAQRRPLRPRRLLSSAASQTRLASAPRAPKSPTS